MEISKIYDNGDEILDRYVITFKGSQEMIDALGLSDDCDSPQGYSQWEKAIEGDHLGKQILFDILPENVQEHIKQCILKESNIITRKNDE